MATPSGEHIQLGRGRENAPLLYNKLAAAGTFVMCPPGALDGTAVGVLIDTGTATYVAGDLWMTRLALGRGKLDLDFRASASPPPADLDSRLSSTHHAGRRVLLTAADVSAFCGSPFDDTTPLTGLVCCATSAGRKPLKAALSRAKPRRQCRFAPLGDHVVVAARLGFTDAAVLRATPKFLAGDGQLRAPAGY